MANMDNDLYELCKQTMLAKKYAKAYGKIKYAEDLSIEDRIALIDKLLNKLNKTEKISSKINGLACIPIDISHKLLENSDIVVGGGLGLSCVAALGVLGCWMLEDAGVMPSNIAQPVVNNAVGIVGVPTIAGVVLPLLTSVATLPFEAVEIVSSDKKINAQEVKVYLTRVKESLVKQLESSKIVEEAKLNEAMASNKQ